MPKVGPCEGCLTHAKTFFANCEPSAWARPIVVVLLPSPRGVGVMPKLAYVERRTFMAHPLRCFSHLRPQCTSRSSSRPVCQGLIGTPLPFSCRRGRPPRTGGRLRQPRPRYLWALEREQFQCQLEPGKSGLVNHLLKRSLLLPRTFSRGLSGK